VICETKSLEIHEHVGVAYLEKGSDHECKLDANLSRIWIDGQVRINHHFEVNSAQAKREVENQSTKHRWEDHSALILDGAD
jgi:hypothetical protein